jgi:hypothetical protein
VSRIVDSFSGAIAFEKSFHWGWEKAACEVREMPKKRQPPARNMAAGKEAAEKLGNFTEIR